MKVLIDADACPRNVLLIAQRLGKQYGVPVMTIASFNHVIDSDQHIIVGDDPQEADMKIINLTKAGDIVVTQDWGLAALVLGKGAHGIHPAGWVYDPDRIALMLEEREVKAKIRRSGGRTKGPSKRNEQNDHAFYEILVKLLQAVT